MGKDKKKVIVTRKQLIEVLAKLEKYEFVNIDYTTPLKDKMLKKDRKTKEANPLIEGFVNKVLNVSALATKNEELSGYQMRARNNGYEGEFGSSWFEHISKVLVTDKKTKTKTYFMYEVHNVSKLPTKPKYFLFGSEWLKPIGDVWKAKAPNKYGVGVRVINTDHINSMTIDKVEYTVQG